MRFDDFMGASQVGSPTAEAAVMRFELGRHLFGAYEGVFGGVVAAAALRAAHEVADGRRPISLECTFLSGLGEGLADARAAVVRQGRVLTFVEVHVHDAEDRLVARATAAFASRDSLHAIDDDGATEVPITTSHAEGRALPPIAPIMETLAARFVTRDDGAVESSIWVPWEDPGRGAEASCMAANISVGAPVGFLLHEKKLTLSTPNPDLSLRFLEEVPTSEFVGVTSLEQISDGLAATRISVVAEEQLAATGVSCTVLLADHG